MRKPARYDKDKNAFIVKPKDMKELLKGEGQFFVVKEDLVTQKMRGYYFGGVIGFVHDIGMYPQLAKLPLNYKNKEGVRLVDVYHELLKRDFNGLNIKLGDETVKVGMSVARYNKERFSEYIGRINEYLVENFGVHLPTPDEYKSYEQEAKRVNEQMIV